MQHATTTRCGTSRPGTVYPLRAVRALALHTQGLGESLRRGARPTADDVYAAIERVGWLQIDTLQVVRRAQYLTLWSRLGSYDPAHLDYLLFAGGAAAPEHRRRLFEYWMHAACIIPLSHYPLAMPAMRRHAEGGAGWRRSWAGDPEHRRLLRSVLARVEAEGPLGPADIRTGKKQPGSWWNWDDAKIALEHLYNTGELAICSRSNFQRVYDLRDRVLPPWVDRREPDPDAAMGALLEISGKALGICTPAQVAHYLHAKQADARPLIDRLIAAGRFVTVTARLADGATGELVVHRDNLPLLQRAADDDLRPRRTTFLSPFDNLFWANGRDLQLWRFRQVLECYKPRPRREWGYFCLPILDRDRLVGRFDPKLERATGLLRLKKLYLEPGVQPSARLAAAVARALRDFMRFHGATDLVVEHSEPSDFGTKLTIAL